MPDREPAAQIDEIMAKKMARALRIATRAYAMSDFPDKFFWTAVPVLAAKIFDKLPNEEE